MPYVFVRERLRCRAPGLDVLAAIHEGLREGQLEGSIHAARFQANYRGTPRLRSFVIGNAVAKASGCELTLRFYVSRDLARLLLAAGALLAMTAALHLWPIAALASAALCAMTIKAALDLRGLSSFFHRLLEP
jgi:hypothetical protein